MFHLTQVNPLAQCFIEYIDDAKDPGIQFQLIPRYITFNVN